jgi:hypothetical protein
MTAATCAGGVTTGAYHQGCPAQSGPRAQAQLNHAANVCSEYRARKKTEQAERVPPDASQPERRPPITRQTAPKAQAGAGGSVVDAIDVQPRKAAHSKANNTKTEAPLGTLNPSPSTSGLLPAASASFQPQAPEASSSAPVAHSASAAPPVDSKTAASAAGHIRMSRQLLS